MYITRVHRPVPLCAADSSAHRRYKNSEAGWLPWLSVCRSGQTVGSFYVRVPITPTCFNLRSREYKYVLYPTLSCRVQRQINTIGPDALGSVSGMRKVRPDRPDTTDGAMIALMFTNLLDTLLSAVQKRPSWDFWFSRFNRSLIKRGMFKNRSA
jgi:hypothetical protein